MQEKDLKIIVKKNVESYRQMGRLTPMVHKVVQSAFGRPDFDINETKIHLKGDIVMVAVCGDKAVAFNTIIFGSPKQVLEDDRFPDTEGCYFAAAAVSEPYQGIGLYQTMNTLRFDIAFEQNFPLVYTRTQNALVETALTHYLRRSKEKGIIKDFSLSRVKIEGCYGQRLTGYVLPHSGDEEIQHAYDMLNLNKGDAYLLMFSLKR